MNRWIKYWISPSGKTYKISSKDRTTHKDELCNIQEYLDYKRNMNFSYDEKKKHIDKDDTYCSMKIGFIRISIFENQVAIQYMRINRKQIDEIYKILSEETRIINENLCVVNEKYMSTTSMFDNINDCVEDLNDNII